MDKREILNEAKEIFKYLADSQLRKNWIEKDIINTNYYYNNQWNNIVAKKGLEEIGCEPITDNKIKPIVDRYLSILIKSGKRVGYLPTTNSQYHLNLSNYIKNWAFNVQTQNNHTFFSSLKCLSSLASGLGWSYFYYENNKFYYESVNPREMYFDPDDLSPRLENQNIIARSYFVNSVRLKNLYPKFSTDFDNMVKNNSSNQYLAVDDSTTISENIWVNGKSIRIVELYRKENTNYFEATCDLQTNDGSKNPLDMQYQEFEDTIFTTFSEDFLDKKNAYDVKVKKGSKIYKTVFCNDVVLFHGPIKEQIPNQVFFPYTPMVYSRDIQGNFIGCIDYLIQLQDLWNVELSKLFHYSNSKMLIVNSDTTTRKYEDLVKAYSIESKKKRGFLQFDPKDVTVIDNSNDIKGILNSLEMLNREFQNISGLFDDFAGKPTNAQSGIAIQNRINTTMNAQNPLILAYEYMLTSEGKLMLDTLKGIENFKQLLSFYNEGKQDSVVLDSNIALLNFEVYPVSAPNFSSSIEEERELFTNIMSSGLADIFLSSPLFLQQVGIGEVSSYKLSSEYKRIMLEKMQLQQGILPNNQENQQEE